MIANDLLHPAATVALAAGWTLHAHRLHQRLHSSRRDPLTGLLTREGWTRRATRTITRRTSPAVVLCDLDSFKPVNDRHGHAAGDAVLAATGHRLADWCGTTGTAGRLGGDEFVAVLNDDHDLQARLTDLADRLRRPVHHDGLVLRVGASLGAAHLADIQPRTLSSALATADAAMYQAKGRTRRGRHAAHAELGEAA